MRTIAAVAARFSRRQFRLDSSPDELLRAAKLIDLAIKIRREVGPSRGLGEACVQAGMIQLQLARQAGAGGPSPPRAPAPSPLEEGPGDGQKPTSPPRGRGLCQPPHLVP